MKKVTIPQDNAKLAKDILNKYKSYAKFSANQNDAYAVSELIGVNVCPYCNINYTYTVFRINKKTKEPVVRPDFDHFEPKGAGSSKELKLSNLIPSCQQCNSRLKGKENFTLTSNLHPYIDDFDEIAVFSINLTGSNYLDPSNFEIVISPRNPDPVMWGKANANIRAFALRERYHFHKNEVIKIAKIISFFNNLRALEVAKLANISVSIDDILREYTNCDINATSLGKLKRDISRDLLKH